MSRDPEDGNRFDPKTLHKYLYASGDPVNRIDPTGRASILETGAIDFDFVLERLPKVVGLTCAAVEVLGFDIELANWVDSKLTGKPKDDFWPEIPTPVELACAIPGFIAAQKEMGAD